MRRHASGFNAVGRERCSRGWRTGGGQNTRVACMPVGYSQVIMIRNAGPEDTESWLVMRMTSWPGTDEPQPRSEIAMMLCDAEHFAVFVCQDPKGKLLCFAEVSLWSWAENCESSPVDYLEGWFVAEHARR